MSRIMLLLRVRDAGPPAAFDLSFAALRPPRYIGPTVSFPVAVTDPLISMPIE
jgi:hypothetical protein